MRKVLIVGDAPSRLNKDPDKAFVGAACFNRLLNWIDLLGFKEEECAFINSNTELSIQMISEWDGSVLALGKKAQDRLNKAKIRHIALPHPSGRNRQLNNRWWLLTQLVNARDKLKLM